MVTNVLCLRIVIAMTGVVLFAGVLPAQRALLDLLPAEADVDGHLEVAFGDEFTALTLPGSGTVFGLAKVGDRCWVLRGSDLHCLDWATKKVVQTQPAPAGLVGLCADARFLYGIGGRDLHVLDAVAGTSMRTVPIGSVWPPSLVFEHAGDVHVVIDRTVLAVDVRTGATKQIAQLKDSVQWLASDGQCVWRGSSERCVPELGPKPAWPGRRWPQRTTESAAIWVEGRLLVAFEEFGRRQTTFGLLAPTVADPEASDALLIAKEGGALTYMMTSHEPLVDDDALRAALKTFAAQPKPLRALALSPWKGVTVGDVRRVWDLAIAAGITDVHCRGLESWGREEQRAVRRTTDAPKK